jgi:DNA-binding response OmpR family regulator
MQRTRSDVLEGARVLVIEDEYFIADDLAKALLSAGADPVGPVATVEQAERLIETQPIDAAIVDLNLRGVMAFDLARRLAAQHLPCLIVSGYSEEALPEGVIGVPRLEKPVAMDAVLRALAAEMNRSIKPRATVQ